MSPCQLEIESAEPIEVDLTSRRIRSGAVGIRVGSGWWQADMRRYPTEQRELRCSHQAVLDENLTCGSWLARSSRIVLVNEPNQTCGIGAAIELSKMGSRQWIAHRSIAGEIRTVDF